MLPSLTVGVLSYFFAKDVVYDEMLVGFKENIRLLSAQIDHTIETKFVDIEYYSAIVSGKMSNLEKNSAEIQNMLTTYVQTHNEVSSLYVARENGQLFINPSIRMPEGYDPKKTSWYIEAMNNKGEIIITEPALSENGDFVLNVARTLGDGSGVIAIAVSLDYIQEVTNSIHLGKEGYTVLLSKERNYISHPSLDAGVYADHPMVDTLFANTSGDYTVDVGGTEFLVCYITNEATGWKLTGMVGTSEISEEAFPIFKQTLLVIAVAIFLGAIIIFIVLKVFFQPINQLIGSTNEIKNGNLIEPIKMKTNDEFGRLGKSFDEMRESLHTLVKEINTNSTKVAKSAEELSASAEQSMEVTQQVSSAIQEISQNAEKQTNGIDETVQSMGELAEQVTQIVESNQKTAEFVHLSQVQAEEGGRAIVSTVQQMNSIQNSVSESNERIQSLSIRSNEIGTILSVITNIAEQTNLLSLNAAIEAARAGEYGKGFAVVADEVRKLAEQSQQAAKEIQEIIYGIQKDSASSTQIMAKVLNDVKNGVQISNEASEKFEKIIDSMKNVDTQIIEDTKTADLMYENVQRINEATKLLAAIANENAATSEEVAASTEEQLATMEEISAAANILFAMSEKLKELTLKFKY